MGEVRLTSEALAKRFALSPARASWKIKSDFFLKPLDVGGHRSPESFALADSEPLVLTLVRSCRATVSPSSVVLWALFADCMYSISQEKKGVVATPKSAFPVVQLK
jgi:hypothetical protein